MRLEVNNSRQTLEKKWIWDDGSSEIQWAIKLIQRKFSALDFNRWSIHLVLFEGHPLYEKAIERGIDDDCFEIADELIPNFYTCTGVEVKSEYIIIAYAYKDHKYDDIEDPKTFLGDINELYERIKK